jgi:hypothetical protein
MRECRVADAQQPQPLYLVRHPRRRRAECFCGHTVEQLSVQRVDVQPGHWPSCLSLRRETLGASRGKNVDVLRLERAYFDKSWQPPDIQRLS